MWCDNSIFKKLIYFFRRGFRRGFDFQRQNDVKGGALVDFAFNLDYAAVQLHDFVDDSEPQSCALNVLAGPVDPIKGIKYF